MPCKKSAKLQRKKLGTELAYDMQSSLAAPRTTTANVENEFSPVVSSHDQELQDDFLKGSDGDGGTLVTTDKMLTDVSNDELTGRIYSSRTKKRKRRISNNTMCKKIKLTDTVVEETPPGSTLGTSGVKTFYCSQNLYESVDRYNPDIMQAIVPSVVTRGAASCQSNSPTTISEFITATRTTYDDDKTPSGLGGTASTNNNTHPSKLEDFALQRTDVLDDNPMQNQNYIMSQLYNSQTQLSSAQQQQQQQQQEYVMSQLYDSSSYIVQNQQSSSNVYHQNEAATIVNDVESQSPSSSSQNVIPNSLLQVADVGVEKSDKFAVADNLSDRSWRNEGTGEEIVSSLVTVAASPTLVHFSLINHPPTDKLCKADFNENIEYQKHDDSFSLTPVDVATATAATTAEDPLTLPPTLLLSNYCSEYDKAYTMRDLKPNQYRNYRHNESLRSLKEHLDSIIPPHVTLKDFYKIKNLP